MFTRPNRDNSHEARFLLDCTPRNLVTHKDKIPMSSMRQIIDFVGSKPFKMKHDLTYRYHNIRIHSESGKNSTLCCHMGKYDSLVMQQGDCTAPVPIMRVMNFLLRNITDLNIYIDDILIANHTYAKHIYTIRSVMRIAKDNKLWFNKNKYQFMYARMQILGNILTDQGLKADAKNIDTVLTFTKPDNKRQVQRFLAMANYLRQFCTELRSVTAPLIGLQGATKYCKWTHLYDVSFEEVKALIISNKVIKQLIQTLVQGCTWFMTH